MQHFDLIITDETLRPILESVVEYVADDPEWSRAKPLPLLLFIASTSILNIAAEVPGTPPGFVQDIMMSGVVNHFVYPVASRIAQASYFPDVPGFPYSQEQLRAAFIEKFGEHFQQTYTAPAPGALDGPPAIPAAYYEQYDQPEKRGPKRRTGTNPRRERR